MKYDFGTLAHPNCGIPSQAYTYVDQAGAPVLIANRYEQPNGKKFFLPYDVTSKEWKAPEVRPLYNLDQIVSAAQSTPIILVEGEKCADALAGLGYVTTTTYGGSNGWRKTDLSPLKDRSVYVWGDHDEPGQKYADDIVRTLRRDHGADSRLIPISSESLRRVSGREVELTKGWDAADAIALGLGRDEISQLLELAEPQAAPDTIGDASTADTALPYPILSGKTGGSAVSTTPENSHGMELWKTPQDETYATLRRNGHFEHWPTGSRTFRNYLSYSHYQAEGKVPAAAALEDRKRTLEGEALFEGETHPVFQRVAAIGRTIYLDLGNPDWQAVAITAEGWQVVDHPQARFRRSPSMEALPIPIRHDQGLEPLRPFLNTGSEDDFRMMVAWLIGCLHPKGPYPILILSGEQGSAKSTTAQTLRDLVDPANPSSRSTPNTEQDLVIAAKHNHVLSFDNLSSVRPQTSDALCRIATGGGFGTRKLHTDTEEVLFNACRPCLLNGIPDLASRPDLADRAIGITLPVIPADQRRTLGSYHRDFAKAAPLILASLLDAVSAALANIDSVSLTEAPRMADFAKWVVAAEPALNWPEGAFLDSYAANRARSDQSAIEGNPVALAVLQLAHSQTRWEGTATDLKQTLRRLYQDLTDDPYGFPRQENKLTNVLRRIQPPLRRRGVSITFRRDGKRGARVIEITLA